MGELWNCLRGAHSTKPCRLALGTLPHQKNYNMARNSETISHNGLGTRSNRIVQQLRTEESIGGPNGDAITDLGGWSTTGDASNAHDVSSLRLTLGDLNAL
jgi:hypothetical protein